jgi:transposase
VGHAGCEAHPAPLPTTEGEVHRRGRPTHPPPVHVRIRLRDFTGQVWAGRSDVRMPFDTNQGERDIRMVQVTQQVSGGFRTLEGAKCFGRMRGYISTAHTHAKHVCEAIRDACDGNPFLPSSARQ